MKSLVLLIFLSFSSFAGANFCDRSFGQFADFSLEKFAASEVVESVRGPRATEPGFVLTLKDGTKAFFKPVNWKRQKMRQLGQHYQSPFHEVAAYRVSELLGFKVVPPTLMRKIKGKLGSFQVYVEGETPRQIAERTGDQPGENKKIWLFDLLIGNIDRSDGNLIIQSDGSQWAIDHGLGFGTNNSLLSNFHHQVFGPPLIAHLKKTLQENPELIASLRNAKDSEIRKAMKGLIGPKRIEALLQRKADFLRIMSEAGI